MTIVVASEDVSSALAVSIVVAAAYTADADYVGSSSAFEFLTVRSLGANRDLSMVVGNDNLSIRVTCDTSDHHTLTSASGLLDGSLDEADLTTVLAEFDGGTLAGDTDDTALARQDVALERTALHSCVGEEGSHSDRSAVDAVADCTLLVSSDTGSGTAEALGGLDDDFTCIRAVLDGTGGLACDTTHEGHLGDIVYMVPYGSCVVAVLDGTLVVCYDDSEYRSCRHELAGGIHVDVLDGSLVDSDERSRCLQVLDGVALSVEGSGESGSRDDGLACHIDVGGELVLIGSSLGSGCKPFDELGSRTDLSVESRSGCRPCGSGCIL